jgi:hypothetical protein
LQGTILCTPSSRTVEEGCVTSDGGDIANQPGFGKIVRLQQSPKFGVSYDIELEDGRELLGIPTILVGNEYHGHGGNRFVTRAAYDAYWKERAEAPAWFHGIEHMTLDDNGYLRWKGHCIERFTPEFAQSDAAKGKARILAARCRHLKEIGEPVNKMNVVLRWGDRVKQSEGEGRQR